MAITDFVKKHYKKGFKFAAIGTIGAIESLITQYILTEYAGIYYIISAIIGMLIGFINNYFLNYYITFKGEK